MMFPQPEDIEAHLVGQFHLRHEFTQALAAVIAPAVVSVAGDYSHVFGPSTTFGKDLMPCVAALLGVALAVIPGAVLVSFTFARRVRPIYRSVRKDVEVIDGRAGELRYRGYSIHDLAPNSTFEETCYLLLKGEL